MQKVIFVEKIAKVLLFCSCTVLFLASCSAKLDNGGGQTQAPLKPLSCIAVLPAETSLAKDHAIASEEARALEKGAEFTTGIIANELSGKPKVRVISSSQVASFVPEISGGLSGMVAEIGKKTHCDGVLLTTVNRFKQREGTEYATADPASASLEMTLMHSRTGAVLWTADFRETQESFLDNVLSYDKMQNRGFKWVSVEQLVEQGVKERLAACPYLQ